MLAGSVTLSSDVQPLNTDLPIWVTLSGTSASVSDEQFENALSLIYVTLDGILTEERFVQPEKAELPIVVMPDGSMI